MKRKEQIDQLNDMSVDELKDQADALKESLFRLKFRKTLGVGDTVNDLLAGTAAGAGIVADSVPESEFQETVNKARAMIKAIEIAESSEPPASAGGKETGTK